MRATLGETSIAASNLFTVTDADKDTITEYAFRDTQGYGYWTINGVAQVLQGEMVSGNYFTQLQVQPMLGRAIQESDDREGAPPVALIVSDSSSVTA